MINFRLEERENKSLRRQIISPFLAVFVALIISSLFILLAGVSPIDSFKELFIGSFGSRNAIAETLSRATPMILTGLAASIAFKARFWNIGAEGQLYAGALAVTFFGTGLVELPSFIMIPFLFMVGALALMESPMSEFIFKNETSKKISLDMQPMGEFIKAADVADMALAVSANRSVNGQIITVDGGISTITKKAKV